jgi:glycogen phosphorylase
MRKTSSAKTPAKIEDDEALRELALDLQWAWNHSTDELWAQLDPDLWDLTHNPWVVLQTVSQKKLHRMASNPKFRKKVDQLLQGRRKAQAPSAWFHKAHANSPLTSVAYFSMEFMLSEAMPIYSGGLGNVAGDQLKAASDLGVPIIAVGLLYQQGYFRQEIDSLGQQQALYPFNDPGQLPIRPLRDREGEWVRLSLAVPGFPLWLRAWVVQVGRAKLYLLDTNDPANLPEHRGIASELYGGGSELRLKQELILGIGGWRLLDVLGLRPEVCHLNEGHAAFAVLERARCYMEETKKSFDAALTVTRAGNLFTTHTPVEAGFDRFSPELMGKYFKTYAEEKLGISLDDLLALGRLNPGNLSEPFNMAYLAMRGSTAANGVSRLHGIVSRRIFQPLFPRWPEGEVPVRHVTNGVHVPTWDSAEADELWTAACGKDRWRGTMATIERDLCCAPDSQLWKMRTAARKCLIECIRERLARQFASRGRSPEEVAQAQESFDFDTLTLGSARRFATYKRPNLLLHDRERLVGILTNPQRPVQLLVAGKAHPQDSAGQAMIADWTAFVRRSDVRSHVAFVSDYDMRLTEDLVRGVDVWINTPRRPWEASGTSGTKVLVNGGLNLSELDGWWAEAYSPAVGWAIGDGKEHGDDPAWDAAEADALYTLLEREVVPEFYTRDEHGVPRSWVARMRESMARLTPAFSANRAVREYTKSYYLPAAAAYRERAKKKGEQGAALADWKRRVEQHWAELRFGEFKTELQDKEFLIEVQVCLGELDPGDVQVELYADTLDGGEPIRIKMSRGQTLGDSRNPYTYSARVPADRPSSDYTPRAVPYHKGASVPIEANQILWQR